MQYCQIRFWKICNFSDNGCSQKSVHFCIRKNFFFSKFLCLLLGLCLTKGFFENFNHILELVYNTENLLIFNIFAFVKSSHPYIFSNCQKYIFLQINQSIQPHHGKVNDFSSNALRKSNVKIL